MTLIPLQRCTCLKDHVLLRWDIALLSACIALFLLFPTLDLAVSEFFYDARQGFPWNNTLTARLLYEAFNRNTAIILFSVAALALAWLTLQKKQTYLRRQLIFFLLCLTLGPGLLVNGIIKTQSGRARPVEIMVFEGNKPYTPPFVIAQHCDTNCSFVSGHASLGFFFILMAWLRQNRAWFWLGIATGTVSGLNRIAQGEHFLSDVIFAFWAIYAVTLLCAAVCRLSPGADHTPDKGIRHTVLATDK